MTRINVGIPPKDLSREHLLAEHREIKRVPNAVRKGKVRLDLPIPKVFQLGRGSVRFFYDKLGYLLSRYIEIYKECRARNFEVTDYRDAWDGIPDELMGDYVPTDADRKLILDRIEENSKD